MSWEKEQLRRQRRKHGSAALLAAAALTLFCGAALAAPVDFNGDGRSDPAAVDPAQTLRWLALINGERVLLSGGFGELGVHLMPGRWLPNAATLPAYVDSAGSWFVLTADGVRTFKHGAPHATYLGGADVDGDGLADALYHTGTCRRGPTMLQVRTAALLAEPHLLSVRGGDGRFYSTYGDADGNGADDFCWLQPVKRGRRLTGRFKLLCRDPVSGTLTAALRVRRVFDRPLPVAQGRGLPDLFAFPRTRRGRTSIVLRDHSGAAAGRVSFAGSGVILIGRYLDSNGSAEQIALAQETELAVFDPEAQAVSSRAAPEGIHFDAINVNHFESPPDCHCDSGNIRQGRCVRRRRGSTLNSPCSVQRNIRDGAAGFLHKPASDSTGSIVNLFNPADRPSACRYERSNGVEFQAARYSGDSNPNRPTWRPAAGGSCSGFPAPLVLGCLILERKHCWTIPDPCSRYD